MSLESADTLELRDRYTYLVHKYVDLAMKLIPQLDEFGRYKKELEFLTAEFARRGVQFDDPEALTKLVEQELKRNTDGNQETDTKEGNS